MGEKRWQGFKGLRSFQQTVKKQMKLDTMRTQGDGRKKNAGWGKLLTNSLTTLNGIGMVNCKELPVKNYT